MPGSPHSQCHQHGKSGLNMHKCASVGSVDPALHRFIGTSALSHIPVPPREVLGLSLTQVHVSSFGSLRIGHTLVDSVQQLLLHLSDGVAVQHLDRDLWGILILRVHTVEGLQRVRKGRVRGCDTLAAKAGPRTQGYSCLQAVSAHLLSCCGVVATWHIPASLPHLSLPLSNLQFPEGKHSVSEGIPGQQTCPVHQSLLRTSNAQALHTPLPSQTIPVETELQVKNQLQAQPGEGSGLSFSWTEDI